MEITFDTGLMGAGKSKKLIEDFKKDKTQKIALAAHLTNKTGTIGKIESRNGSKIRAVYLHEDIERFVRNLLSMKNIDSIYIDEVQFLTKIQVLDVVHLCYTYNVDVHFYGLSTTFSAEYFESSKVLIQLHSIKFNYLSMTCQIEDCLEEAEFNGRIIDGKVAREGDTFLVAKSKYLALCKKHYNS